VLLFSKRKQVSKNKRRPQSPARQVSDGSLRHPCCLACPNNLLGNYDTNFFSRLATPSPAGASRP
jgi:hypothetical protein